ncbi:MAG: hypothetical protein QM626_10475 [Microbacterium sp.]|uniref:hypothetical protein n=1 Tax=Microbacterium sp. TaxID=51671 RepID=UPI0039E2C162
MRTVENARWTMEFDRGGGVYESVRLDGCEFDNCGLSLVKSPERMSLVRDVVLSGCRVTDSEIGPCLFQDVVVDGLTTNPTLSIWSAFFRRVTLVGKVGKININTAPSAFFKDADVLDAFAEARRDFYEHTDWALDISEARFVDLSCSGVPLDKIRRDPESQFILERAAFDDFALVAEDFKERFRELHYSIVSFLESDREQELLVVPLAAPRARRAAWSDGLEELRLRGFVEGAERAASPS